MKSPRGRLPVPPPPPLGAGAGLLPPPQLRKAWGAGGEAWRGQWPRSPGLGPVGPIELRGCVWGQGSRSLKGRGGRGARPGARCPPQSHGSAPHRAPGGAGGWWG